jgi:hypothetical protein
MPMMPMMPMPTMMNENLELKATGQNTNILGFACQQYELKQHGETMEIWATDQLMPYHPYIQNQPHSPRPRMMEEQWAGLMADRKLFPMIASLRYNSGAERFHFEVTTVSMNKVAEPDEKRFQPPPDYNEIQPLQF